VTVYYTQLIFLREGREDAFHSFEDHVLPLLAKYNGELLYRARPSRTSVIESTLGHPYEVHLITFDSRQDFEAYAADEERQRHLSLKDESVERVLLIEGIAI
jgi:uncharacterized protein (DUF1330 family)